ncbi:MAG: MFS transporter [Flammeovirgaceae bacterium]
MKMTTENPPRISKPRLSFWQIWNMSFGFLGIQFGFALQNANASRILQTFGADVEHLSWFWLVAPITGLIVQPIIGHYSDRTWNWMGRRKPYFLVGAILASLALMLMPNSKALATFMPAMFVGAGMLMVMDASFNIAMEPFRALVADMLPDEQRTKGFAIQTTLIGVGAVAGSWMPYILGKYFSYDITSTEADVPNNVVTAFYIGAITLIGSILWTNLKTKEYPPDKYKQFHESASQEEDAGIRQILKDFNSMPRKMKQLGLVQFLSWFALFSMWVFSTPAIAQHVYKVIDVQSSTYQEAGNWVGVIFGVYNGVSALYALALPYIAKATNRKTTHAISLVAGGLGLISVYFISDPNMLIISMIGVGMAWASILAMPYAMLASAIPSGKMGIYMGIFNFFIVIPQIVNGIVGGPIVKYLYNSQAIYALLMAGVFMILAAFAVMTVKDEEK